MRANRLPLLGGIWLALAATVYFATTGDNARLIIVFHALTLITLAVSLLVRKYDFFRGRQPRPVIRSASLVLAGLWLVALLLRFLALPELVTPLLLVVATLTFLLASVIQDSEISIQTRPIRIIDGFLLAFVVIGVEWFTLIETADLTVTKLLACILASLPFVSLLLFVIYAQRLEYVFAALGIGLASAFSLAWINQDGQISPVWDLVAMVGLVSLSIAFITPRREMAPSLLGPLLPYLLGIFVIVLGVIHEVFGNMTRIDVSLIAAAGITLVSRQLYALIEQRRLLEKVSQHESQLRHIAMHDVLTSLPNRFLFQDRLEHAVAMRKRDGGDLTLIYIDIDNFKQINDEYGHVIGDELLIHVAQRLATWVRPSDTVARLGGDEFAVLMESGQEGALRVAQRLSSELAHPYDVSRRTLMASASIGLYTCTDWQGDVVDIAERIVNQADRAMYLAKSNDEHVRAVD